MNNFSDNNYKIKNEGFYNGLDLGLSRTENKNYENGFNEYNFRIAIQRFILQVDVSISSRETYKRGLNKFLKWCVEFFGINRNFILTRDSILLYKQFLDISNLKPFTKSLYLVCLRQFFAWTESILLYPNISKGIKGIKRLTRSHHKDSLNKELIRALLGSINKNSLVGLRDYTIIYLLVHTGMRLIEISGILISDIERNLTSKTARLWIKGKGRDGKDNFVVLLPQVLSVLDFYIEKKGKVEKLNENSFLFQSHRRKSKDKYPKKMSSQSLSRIIRLRLKSAGIKTKRVSAHSLRHTFGVLAIKGGATLYEVQLAMRHSSPATTQVYLGDIEQIKRQEASPEQKVKDLLSFD